MFKKYLDAQMPIPTSGNYNDQKNIGGQNVEFRQNDLPALQEFEITAVVGATGMQNNVLLIPGPNPTFLSSKLSLFETTQTAGSAGLLLSSTVSANTADGWIELKDYITANSMWCKYLRIQTSDTSVYDGALYIGESKLTGINAPSKMVLSAYATSLAGGGSYDKTLNIDFGAKGLVINRATYMYISKLPSSATVTFAFGVMKNGIYSPLTDIN